MLVPCRPSLRYPLYNSFWLLAKQEVSPRFFTFWRLFGVLVNYRTPSFIAAVNFNEKVFARDLIPKVQGRVRHHGFNIMIGYIIVSAMNPFVSGGKYNSFTGKTMQWSCCYCILRHIICQLLGCPQERF